MNIDWDDSNLHFQPKTTNPSDHGIPVPFYGLYGGPNWSAGELDGNPLAPGAPAGVSDLDLAFQAHDIAYASNQNIAQADFTLLTSIDTLQFNDAEDSIYAGFASLSIIAKIVTSGELAQLTPGQISALPLFAVNAIEDFEAGLAAAPQEGRSLHGALHVFEAQYLPDLIL